MTRISFNIPKNTEDAKKIQGAPIDPSVGTPSDGDILVYRDAGNDWVTEAKPSGGGTPAWGDITGTVSNQTDLQTELDGKQDSDAQLTSLAGLAPGAEGKMITSDGLGGFQMSTAADVRSYVGVDPAGTDNSTDVTLAGSGTYLSLSGQEITVDPITESDITDLGDYAKAGSLTLRFVPFASTSDGVTLTDGPMYYNPINGYLGFSTTSPASKFHAYQNNTETGAGGGITIEQDGEGDATIQFLLTGRKRWPMGVDNSDGDKFKIANSNDIGTGTQLTLDGSTLTIPSGNTFKVGTSGGVTGSFTTTDGKTVTVTGGIITSIV